MLVLLKHHDLDIFEPNLIAVVLQVDMAGLKIAEAFPSLVLTVGNKCIPFLCVPFIFDDLDAVKPMLNMIAIYHNHRGME